MAGLVPAIHVRPFGIAAWMPGTRLGMTNSRIDAMANISAQMVKELRESTGAGMMDCKAALTETQGDMTAAQDWLRKKGLSKAAKKAGRVAAEGLIGVKVAGVKGVVVEVNSETDFVARNDLFQGLVAMIADVALDVGPDVEKIKAAKVGAITVADAINDSIAKIGENMTLRRAAALAVKQGAVGMYVHNSVSEGLGKIGVLMALESSGKADELVALGRMVAMHVAASNPQAIEPSGLDPAVVKREKDVLADKFRQQGKPENVIEKIVDSGLKTFYKEVCLLEQPYVHDPAKSVAQALKEAEGKVGAPIKVTGFVRFALGEGIEKNDTDFVAEVAAAAGQG
jgi:elongation factor Ts